MCSGGVTVPFVLDQVTNHVGREDVELVFGGTGQSIQKCLALFFLHAGQQVALIGHRVLFRPLVGGTLIFGNLPFLDLLFLLFQFLAGMALEHVGILIPELEDGAIVRSLELGYICAAAGPLIVLEGVIENLRVEERSHIHLVADQLDQVTLEQVSIFVAVLITNYVLDHFIHRSDLVVLRSNVDSRSTVRVLVEDWEFIKTVLREEVRVLWPQKMGETSGVESEIWNHTLDAELQINFEKDMWRRLHAYQVGDLGRRRATVQTLHQEELSKSDVM